MSWTTVTLSEAAHIISGGTPKSGVAEYWEGDVEWITPKDMGKMTGIYAFDTGRKITELGLSKSSAKLIAQNSVILSTRAPIGHLAINTVPMATNQGCRGLVPKDNLDTKYLYYFLSKSVELLNDLGSGTTFKELSKGSLEKVTIPLPTLIEQKRIVALLDTVFADLEQTRAKTEQNLKNARELFDSYLQQVFSQKGEGWVDGKMTDICEINTKLIDPKEDEYLDLLHIGAGNIVSNTGEIIKLQTAKEEGLISGKFVFDNSMILYSKIRPYLMKVCRPEFTGLCSADIYPLSPIKEVMDKDFLFYLLLSKDFTDYAISGSGRAGMPKVNRTHLFNYSVSIPPIEKQREFIIKINQVASQSQDLERIYKSKLVTIDELKKSILQKAFNGELTQD